MSLSPIRDHFGGLLRRLRSDYYDIIASKAARGSVPQPLWGEFRKSLTQSLVWSCLASGANVRYKATHQRIVLPDSGEVSLANVLDLNEWTTPHLNAMADRIEDKVALVIDAERRYVDEHGEDIMDYGPHVPRNRLEMIYRNAVGDLGYIAAQVQLSSPEVGDALPYILYLTKNDKRVRSTHALMHGFIALRTWDGWSSIRPKNGYNCRCYLRYHTWDDAIRLGWAWSIFKPRWDRKWPNRDAQRNYEDGTFPDPGWNGPKYVAD